MASKRDTTPEKRRQILRSMIARHDLTSGEVAVMVDQSRHTVLAWMCGARAVPQRALRLLAWELRARE